MKIVCLLLLLTVPLIVDAQPQTPMISLETIGGDVADQVYPYYTKSSDGGIIIGLGSNSLSGPVIDDFCSTSFGRTIFVKISGDGMTKEWSKCYGNNWNDSAYIFMFETIDNEYVLGGMKNSGNRWIVRKEDATGGLIWHKSYGGSGTQQLYSMTETADGGYVLFGSAYLGTGDMGFHYGSTFTRDFWVLKVDANGEKVWSKIYGGTGDDIGASVLSAADGGCYIVGSAGSTDYDCTDNHGFNDVFVARLNTDGDMIWHKCMGGSAPDGATVGCGATDNGSGGILIAAITASVDGDVTNRVTDFGSNIWLISLDSSGNVLWDNCYGGSGQEYPNSVCRGADGDIWIMGCSQTAGGQVAHGYGDKDAWLVHTDSDGNFLNAKVVGSSRKDVGTMVCPIADGSVLGGGYYTCGDEMFSPFPFYGGSLDAFLAKFANWANEIHPISLNASTSISPNPASDFVQIRSKNFDKASISVTDIMGKVVYTGEFRKQLQLSVQGWHRGVYFVQVHSGNERVVRPLVLK